jgi:stage V sporulation protein B
VAGGFLRRQLGAFLPWLSLVRVGLATAAALALGRVLPLHGTLMTLVEAAAVGLAFLLALVVTGELKRSELQAIGRVLTRKRGAS